MTGVVKVIDKKTGEEKIAVYMPNRLGNKQYNIDGKFFTDRKFNSKFKIK